MRAGYILQDRQERRTATRVSTVRAYRLVDDVGSDILLPWFDSKAEVRRVAKQFGIVLLGTYPPTIPRVVR